MKTFLNVLYRRILYKIPLKLLLLLLAVFGVLFACFSSADDNAFIAGSYTLGGNSSTTYGTVFGNSICVGQGYGDDGGGCQFQIVAGNKSVVGIQQANKLICLTDYGDIIPQVSNLSDYACNFRRIRFNYNSSYFGDYNPPYTSLQCQTEYNLIPVESVDQNYCTTNNLCPTCPVCPSIPVGTGGYSQLYINNILHLGAPNIIMNIPDEIDWDYAYTQGGQNMNIDVVGYNVDYEKIDSIVQFQNYKPTSEDFQKIIGLLAPYTKIIVFFVFLFIVWAWIKKPFKSKKL